MMSRSDLVWTRAERDAWILSLPRDLGAAIEEDLGAAVDRALAANAVLLVLDFSSVTFADSAGVGALVDLMRRARERTIRVALVGTTGQPRLILERVGFLEIAPSFESVDEALRTTPRP